MYKIKLKTGRLRRHLLLNSSESGRVSLKVIIWIVLISVAGYSVYTFVPPYVSYKMLQYEVEGEAKVAHLYSDEDIKDRILEKADSWSVDIDESDIEIIRDREEVQIGISYEVRLMLLGGYAKTLFYDIYVVEPLQER